MNSELLAKIARAIEALSALQPKLAAATSAEENAIYEYEEWDEASGDPEPDGGNEELCGTLQDAGVVVDNAIEALEALGTF